MVRNYKRKREPVNKEQLKKAILAVKTHNMRVSGAAKMYDVPRTTLIGWLKFNNNKDIVNMDDISEPYHGGSKVNIMF